MDPDERDMSRSESQFSFLYPLKDEYEKVVACELVDYSVRKRLQRTFVEATDGKTGNNLVDIHMEDVATGLQVLDFTLVIPPETFTSPIDILTSYLNTQMDAQAHPYHNTGNGVVWSVTTLATTNANGIDGALNFNVELASTPGTIAVSFLFGSGANAANSAAVVLGFEPGVDTPLTTDGPVPSYVTTPTPFRYLNVTIREFDEHKPLATIFLTDTEDYSLTREGMHRPRLLTAPTRDLYELRVDLTLPDGRYPTPEQCGAVDLVFDLLLLAPESSVPAWVNHQFLY